MMEKVTILVFMELALQYDNKAFSSFYDEKSQSLFLWN